MEHFKNILLVASFLFPLTLSLILLYESGKNTSRKIMAVAQANTAVLFFMNYLYFYQDFDIYLPLHSFHAGIELLVFPVIYLYMKSVIIPDFKIKAHLLHFLPGVLMILLATYIFYMYAGYQDLEKFLTNNKLGIRLEGYQFFVLKISRYIHLFLVVLQGIAYSIAFFRTPKEYNDRLKNEFSNIENFSIGWINRYNLTFMSLVMVGFILYAFVPLKGFYEFLIILTFFFFSVFVSVLGVVSLRQRKAGVNLEDISVDVTDAENMLIAEDDALMKKLKKHMQKNKVYLQPDVSLTQLSRELGTNRTYLSQLINQQLKMNFCNFINQYRLQEIENYLKEKPDATNQELADMAGFGSVLSMKRAMGKI
jgi:AraC-like DNA-binding protein